MCGIAGFVASKANVDRQTLSNVISNMTAAISHRGPDDVGIWVDDQRGLSLGHRRLSIMDISQSGHQPMTSKCGRYISTYNGEIYNHQEIRHKIDQEQNAIPWRGTSDTEVILEAISRWGLNKALQEFVGMFAFAIWDQNDEILYLVRDRIGEKPLYYGWSNDIFLFGSELKPLCVHPSWRGEVDRDVLGLYFRNNYVPAPYSIYKNIFKLLPGTFLKFELKNMMPGELPKPVPYWSILEAAQNGIDNPFSGTDQEAIFELDMILRESVRGQMISDVPLGAFLSGGVDSSAIVALMQSQSSRPVRTFTIGFRDIAYNEAPCAKTVAKHIGTDHTESYVTPEECISSIPELPKIYDEPFADSSQIPTYLVCKLARQCVSVSLSGDGGDEVFLGYNRHFQLNRIQSLLKAIPFSLRKIASAGLNLLPASFIESILHRRKYGVLADQVQKIADIITMNDPDEMYRNLTRFWEYPSTLVLDSHEKQTLLTDRKLWPDFDHLLHRIMYIEQMTSLPDDMLVKVDRAAMGIGLETRVPFLDHRLIEFSWRLPLSMKYRDGLSKWILRQILYKYVPSSLIERPKAGFGIPIDTWLKGPLRDWAEELLKESRLRNQGYLNAKMVNRKWSEHLEGRKKWQPHLWGVLMFQAWMENYQH